MKYVKKRLYTIEEALLDNEKFFNAISQFACSVQMVLINK